MWHPLPSQEGVSSDPIGGAGDRVHRSDVPGGFISPGAPPRQQGGECARRELCVVESRLSSSPVWQMLLALFALFAAPAAPARPPSAVPSSAVVYPTHVLPGTIVLRDGPPNRMEPPPAGSPALRRAQAPQATTRVPVPGLLPGLHGLGYVLSMVHVRGLPCLSLLPSSVCAQVFATVASRRTCCTCRYGPS